MWWGRPDVALPSSNIGTNNSRSFAGNVVSVLEPVDDERGAGQLLAAGARQPLQDDLERSVQGAGGVSFNGIFPAESTSPYLPTDILHGWGTGSGQVGNLWAAANDVYAHNDTLQFSDKLTKLAGAHGLKFGITVERGQKQQNFQNVEAGQLWFGIRQRHRHRQLRRRHAGRPDRLAHAGHGGQRQPGAGPAVRRVPLLEPRRVRAGQLEAALEPDARNTACASAAGRTTRS